MIREVSVSSNFNSVQRKRARVFYMGAFFNALSSGVVGPLFIVYLLSINLSVIQIGLLLAVERIATIICEFPTGIFADRYGRKKSVLLSFALLALLLIVWFFSKNFVVLVVMSFFWGLAYAFQSGAKESLMIESLQLEHNDSLRNHTFARLASSGNFGLVIGGLVAAGLALISLRSIWLVAASVNALLLVLFLLFTHEIQRTPNNYIRHYNKIKELLTFSRQSLHVAFTTKPIRYLLGITMVIGFVTATYGLSYPILFKQAMGLPNYYFGLLGSVAATLGIVGAFFGERVLKRTSYHSALACFAFILVALFAILGFAKTLLIAVSLFAMIEFTLHGWFPVYQSFFNKFIPSDMRAGLLSVNSTASLLAIAGGEIIAGVLLIIVTPASLIALSGLLLIGIPLLLARMSVAPPLGERELKHPIE